MADLQEIVFSILVIFLNSRFQSRAFRDVIVGEIIVPFKTVVLGGRNAKEFPRRWCKLRRCGNGLDGRGRRGASSEFVGGLRRFLIKETLRTSKAKSFPLAV